MTKLSVCAPPPEEPRHRYCHVPTKYTTSGLTYRGTVPAYIIHHKATYITHLYIHTLPT